MSDDAGFAVAITVRQNLLNNAILIAYASDTFPHTLSHDLPDGPPDASIDFFLGPPQITCKSDNTMTIAVDMWGSMSVTLNSAVQTGDVAAHLTIRIQPSFEVRGNTLVLGFDDINQDVVATEWDYTVIGAGFTPDADSYLRSDVFRARLQHAIQLAILLQQVKLPNIDISFLGDGILNAVKGMMAYSRVVDGALLLGLDIDVDAVTGHITTTGDVNQLVDFARGNDVAAVTNAVAVPVLLQQVQSEVSDQVAQAGASLDKLQITAQNGRFHVEGKASNSQGTANFSFNITPSMYAWKPGAFFQFVPRYVKVNPRSWPALGFTTTDVQTDVDTSPWLTIISVILAVINPIIPVIVFTMASDTAYHLNGDITSANTGTPLPRVQHLKPSTPGGPRVRVEIADYEITTDGTYIGITARPQALPGALIGLTSIPSDFSAEPLGYTVRLPLGIVTDDPALRIRWTVNDSSGNILLTDDGKAAGREQFTLSPAVVAPGSSPLGIGVRVYRALGAQLTDFLNDSITLNIRGPLPRGAYVRWYYDVKNPQVTFDDKNQSWAYKGELRVKRHSNLHRTDQPCKNAQKRSRYEYQTDILDSLPFPLADIALHRSELCDYCFFGGPGGVRPAL